MSESKIPLASAVQDWAAEARARIELHPAPADLLRYHAGEMSPWQQASLQEHLYLCPECARRVVDLNSFPRLEAVVERSDAEVAADWQEIRDSLLEEPRLAEVRAFSARRSGADRIADGESAGRLLAERPWAWAAVLAPAILGLGLWLAIVQGSPRPQVNVEIVDLVPVEEALVRDEVGQGVALPAAASSIVLVLNVADVRAFAAYRLEISDGDGYSIGRYDGLIRGREGNFTLALPRRDLPSGDLRFDLYGIGDSDELLATYRARFAGGD